MAKKKERTFKDITHSVEDIAVQVSDLNSLAPGFHFYLLHKSEESRSSSYDSNESPKNEAGKIHELLALFVPELHKLGAVSVNTIHTLAKGYDDRIGNGLRTYHMLYLSFFLPEEATS